MARQTRLKSGAEVKAIKDGAPPVSNTVNRIVICPDGLLQNNCNEEDTSKFIKLRHSRTNQGALFLFNEDDSRVFEVLHFKEEFRSWFLGSTVVEDGSLYIVTPVDPGFLILPYLMRSENLTRFIPLEQILEDEEYPECARLGKASSDSVSLIADVKGNEDIKAVRFSKEKTLNWLQKKVEQLMKVLESEGVNVQSGAISSLLRIQQTATLEEYKRYATGLVSQYLSTALENDLVQHLGIKYVEPLKHEKPPLESTPADKKARLDGIAPMDDYQKIDDFQKSNGKITEGKKVKATAAQRALSKVDKSGMKNISSFFSPKAGK